MKPHEENEIAKLMAMPVVTVEQVINFRTAAVNLAKRYLEENEGLHKLLDAAKAEKQEVVNYAESVIGEVYAHAKEYDSRPIMFYMYADKVLERIAQISRPSSVCVNKGVKNEINFKNDDAASSDRGAGEGFTRDH